MTKILRLREWVSIQVAAEYLSKVLEEPVSELDLYVLAAEQKLKLSVCFPTDIWAAEVVRLSTEAEVLAAGEKQVTPPKRLYLRARNDYWTVGEDAYSDGLFDFAMEGGEVALLRRWAWGDRDPLPDPTFYEILLRRSTGELICPGDLHWEHADDPFPSLRRWNGLPEDARLCLRVSELDRLIGQLSERHSQASRESVSVQADKPISQREHTTYLNIIGAMLEMLQNPRPGRDTQAGVITELVSGWSDKPGISKANLEKKFAEAKRKIAE